MGRPKQNLPRKLAGARRAQPDVHARRSTRPRASRHPPVNTSGVLAAIATLTLLTIAADTILAAFGESTQAAHQHRIDNNVSTLLSGIPQHGSTLGNPSAPVTMQIYSDLECQDSREWFTYNLPTIIRQLVRPRILKLEYHSFKTNTIWPQTFVNQQTAALAAGAQNKLWNYIDTFYPEQRTEYTHYANQEFLQNIATQVPGLNIPQWHQARQTERRSEQITTEDHTARTTLHLHVTPTFLIGLTGHKLHRLTSPHRKLYTGQHHYVYYVDTEDIEQAIHTLDPQLAR
jgi:protein-disulfide isomerase